MSLDATVGGSSSNSYVSQSEATTYFSSRLYTSDWTGASSSTKDSALITATQRIDQEFFEGTRVTSTQALKWPRLNVEIPNEHLTYSYPAYFSSTVIPQKVKDAVCEFALFLLATDALKPTGLENFKELTVGPIKLVMNQPVLAGRLPDQVLRLLRGLISSGTKMMRA